MDHDGASSAEMRRPASTDPLALDDASVERLLSGTLPAASAPPGYAGVARLLAATVAPPTSRELAGQTAVLAELRAVTRGRRDASPARPARPRRRRAGLVAVVVMGALATGGVAAATGHLPAPVREAARSVLGASGGGPATSPSPAESAAPGTAAAGSGGTGQGGSPSALAQGRGAGSAVAGPAAGPALTGLCQAFQEGNGSEQGARLDAPIFEELVKAAGGADKVPAFCEQLLATGAKASTPTQPTPADPPEDPGQGQGAPPTGGGGGTSGSGSGAGQAPDSPPAASAPTQG
jgi:hypothetical protein